MADCFTFRNITRMSPSMFNKLLEMVGPKLAKKDTKMRRSIPVEQRLALTLRFLASGDCMRSLSYAFRIGHSTVSKLFVKLFSKIWNFLNCIGAGDGKHFSIQCPSNSGSTWYNYKGFHSMDDAFPLMKNIMKPYPGRSLGTLLEGERTFNYRLSRARRTVENAFGIIVSKLRIFYKPIIASPSNVEKYIKAGVALHNMLIPEDSRFYLDNQKLPDHFDANGKLIEGAWRSDVTAKSMFR
ncbi:hypothetical protein GHT06_019074 [Daphnia sinensis]|uniref:DDE Tnp4 domain-containing protein n=1 Tax=Daphnia sinensis TaxID=1820382 RepID=A0AAD5KJI9_9CRUS|nr:hypothetical protein GHT06_019074 [Daphnia sinensis]